MNLKTVSPYDAAVLHYLALVGCINTIGAKKRCARNLATLGKNAKPIGEALLDLYAGRPVKKSKARKCALGFIRWMFTNHLEAWTSGQCSNPQTCTCEPFRTCRKILRKYGKLKKALKPY